MAQIPVLSRQRFCVEEEKKLHELPLSSSSSSSSTLENNSSLGITTRLHVPPQEEERRNAVAIEVVADDDEEEEDDEEDVEAVFTSVANPRPTFNVVALGKFASQETSIKPVKWLGRHGRQACKVVWTRAIKVPVGHR
ncbi:unnamed protein product [Sphagnum compactum]